jgi:hypothetical protein
MRTKAILEDVDVIGLRERQTQRIIQVIRMIAKKIIPTIIQNINVKVMGLDIIVTAVDILMLEVTMVIGAIITAKSS